MYEQAREWLLWANPPPNLDRAFAIIKEENNNKELVSFKTIEGRDATSKILLLLWQSLLTIKNLRKISSFDLTTIINRGTHGPHVRSYMESHKIWSNLVIKEDFNQLDKPNKSNLNCWEKQ